MLADRGSLATTRISTKLGALARALGLSPPAAAEARAEAFAALYRAQFDRVYAYLRYRVGNRALAEDLAAEVFVRAWAKLRAVDHPQGAVAWLFVTARHLAVDHYRSSPPALSLEALAPDVHPTSESPDEQVLAAERAALAMSCLRALGEREREVVVLRFVAGLRNREIARVVGTSEGNVAKIIHRALRKLRAHLGTKEGC
ncbi:MAG TPA: sigma-70 family RNA polymerase sigma factor [Chloroflexota bacterium]